MGYTNQTAVMEPWLAATLARMGPTRTAPVASVDGGVQTRLDTPWPGPSKISRGWREQDTSNFADLRARARNLEIVNWLACGMLDRAVENVVGTTFRVEPATDDPEHNAQARAWWRRLANTTAMDLRNMFTLGGLLRMAYRAKLRDGDVGVVLATVDDFRNGRRVRLPKLQIIEGDRIKNPWWVVDGYLSNGNLCVDGVEMDIAGRPLAYWVEWIDRYGAQQFDRVEARDFIFLHRSNRYSNVRGESIFRGGFGLFEQLAGVIESIVVAWRVGASQAMIAKRRNPGAAIAGLKLMNAGPGTDGQTQQQSWMPIQPGMVNFLNVDEELTGFNPTQPQQNFPQALDAFCRIMGVKFGLTLEQVLLNFAQVTFHAGRAARIQAESTAAIEQDDLANNGVSRIYGWAKAIAEQNGEFTGPIPQNSWAHEWIPSAKPWVDPQAELTAAEKAIKLGVDARSYIAMGMGYHFPDLVERNKADRELMVKAGLPLFEDPQGGGGVQVDENGNLKINPGQAGTQGQPQQQPLNGIQITAAMDVLAKLAEKTIPSDAAIEMLERLGIAPDKAQAIAKAAEANRTGISASDREFQRNVLLKLLEVQGAKQAVYNLTDVEDLIAQTGLPPEKPVDGKDLQAPFLPVVSDSGPLVDGDVIKDPAGDIVGGDVAEPAQPDPQPQTGAGNPPNDPQSGQAAPAGVP